MIKLSKNAAIIVVVLISLRTQSAVHAQYQWTPPIPIDTSVYGPQLGGMMAIDDSGCIYVTWAEQPDIVVERSSDHGITWRRSDYTGTELSRVPRDIVIDHNGNVWLVWVSWQSEFSPAYVNLSKSVDSGQSFTTVFHSYSYFSGQLFQKLAVDNRNNIYMLWDDTQFKLTTFHGGDPSQRVDAAIPTDTLLLGSYPALAVSSDSIVHCLWEGAFFDQATGYHEFVFYSRSKDTGATFQGKVRVDTTDMVGTSYVHHLPSIAVDMGGTVFASYTRELMVNKRDIRLVTSSDGGQSFAPPVIISDSDAWQSNLTLDSEKGVNVLWGMSRGTIHRRSVDHGLTFAPPALVGPIGFDDSKAWRNGFLYVTGENNSRIYFSRTNVILSAPETAQAPTSFTLSPNYPNPFNSSTVIRFSVGTAEFTDVGIFDVLGHHITTLVSEKLAAGTYSIRWDATTVSSGVYVVRVVAGRHWVGVRKMILLR